jgi:hypothetical protein
MQKGPGNGCLARHHNRSTASITRRPQDTVTINPTKRDPDAEVTMRILKPRNPERKGDGVILLPFSINQEL